MTTFALNLTPLACPTTANAILCISWVTLIHILSHTPKVQFETHQSRRWPLYLCLHICKIVACEVHFNSRRHCKNYLVEHEVVVVAQEVVRRHGATRCRADDSTTIGALKVRLHRLIIPAVAEHHTVQLQTLDAH